MLWILCAFFITADISYVTWNVIQHNNGYITQPASSEGGGRRASIFPSNELAPSPSGFRLSCRRSWRSTRVAPTGTFRLGRAKRAGLPDLTTSPGYHPIRTGFSPQVIIP